MFTCILRVESHGFPLLFSCKEIEQKSWLITPVHLVEMALFDWKFTYDQTEILLSIVFSMCGQKLVKVSHSYFVVSQEYATESRSI